MTWITDDTGRRWVEETPRKQRSSPRAIRFADLKVGDQLALPAARQWDRHIPVYYVVTDLWFDPVAGERNEIAGRMVAIARIGGDGELRGSKRRHTLRGLASQGFQYAETDVIAQGKATVEAWKEGKVIGIGQGAVIRRRPKLPISRL